MKIRIKGNSVRMRIVQPELETFAQKGYLEDKTEFGATDFVYALQSLPGVESLSATFNNHKLTIFVPEAMKKQWVETDIVGFDADMDTGGGKKLYILIEKDWACIDNTTEDQSKNFPNPNAAC